MPVVALNSAIDPKLREKCELGIVRHTTEAQLVRKASGTTVIDRAADGKALQPFVRTLSPWVDAHPSDHFGLVSGVIHDEALAIENSHPVLNSVVKKNPVRGGAWRPDGPARVRV